MNSPLSRISGTCLIISSLCLFGGCRSKLRVEVDVYTGPLVWNEKTRVSSAVGLARSIRNIALRDAGGEYDRADRGLPAFYVQRAQDDEHSFNLGARRRGAFDFNFLGPPSADYVAISPPSVNNSAHHPITERVYLHKDASRAQLLVALAEYYSELNIDRLHEQYLASSDLWGTSQPSVAVQCVNDKLFSSLLSFSECCSAIGLYVGMPQYLHWKACEDRRWARLRLGTILEETGRQIRIELDSVHHQRSQPQREGQSITEISSLMASQAPGTMVSTAAIKWPWAREYAEAIFQRQYWKTINTVKAQGSGDVNYMLIKDEIGNWHLKRATVDPSQVLNAIHIASVTAVRIAANAIGAPPMALGPVSKLDITPNTPSPPSEHAQIRAVLQQLLTDTAKAAGDKEQLIQAIDKAIDSL